MEGECSHHSANLSSLVLIFLPLLRTYGGQLKDLCVGISHFISEKELNRVNFHKLKYLWDGYWRQRKQNWPIADRRIPNNDARSLCEGIPRSLCVGIRHLRNEKETGPS